MCTYMNVYIHVFSEVSGAAAAVVGGEGGSHIYVMGGFNGEACTAANQIFDVEMGKWRAGAPLLAPRSGAVAATIKDTIYLIGAHHPTPCVQYMSSMCVCVVDKHEICYQTRKIACSP
jgi:hypothetical protein